MQIDERMCNSTRRSMHICIGSSNIVIENRKYDMRFEVPMDVGKKMILVNRY
jgi:hypothetical protein